MEKSLTPIFVFAAVMLLTARAAPRWALRRPALMGVLVAALTAWGLIALRGLPVELMPNAASETVTVSVSVRGGDGADGRGDSDCPSAGIRPG